MSRDTTGAVADTSVLRAAFGSLSFDTGAPLLAGPATEEIFGNAEPAGAVGVIQLARSGPWLLGGATVPLTDGLETATRRLYTDLLQAVRGLHLARIWNYVPAINAIGPGGLENYRIFSRARSLAFEEHFGAAFKPLLPSASAVGAKAPALTVAFAASATRPRHVENPLQVSAYNYPSDYGPRAPSFARATVVPGAAGQRLVFISGTAAIRGHATIAPHQLLPQLECTLENLQRISEACEIGPDLARGRAQRHFKVYLRHPADQPAVASRLARALLAEGDIVSYLHADICRDSLVVEIEATLLGV